MSLLEFFSAIFPNNLELDEYLLLIVKNRVTGQMLEVYAEGPLQLSQIVHNFRSPAVELYFGLATWRNELPCRAMTAWIGSDSSLETLYHPLTLEYPRGVLHCWPFPEPVRCDRMLRAMNRALIKRYGGTPEFSDMRAMAAVPDGPELAGTFELSSAGMVVQ